MTVRTAPIEHEAKFDVNSDFDPPDLRDLLGRTERLPEVQMRTVYFDTPDRRLLARGIAFRHRTTGHEEGTWTLKLPGQPGHGMLHRPELSWTGEAGVFPAPALSILRAMVRRSDLRILAELETTRRRLALYDHGSEQPWGELDDDLVRVQGGSNDGARFRQIELELATTNAPMAASVMSRLRRRGAKPTGRSKLVMAVGGPPGEGRPYRRSRRGETLVETIERSIRAGVDRLLDHDYRLRLVPLMPDAEDVHQARVATRRLRSDLKTLGPVLDPVWLRHTNDELRWIGSLLGQVRDLDVLSGSLFQSGDSVGGTEGADVLAELLRSQRQEAAARLAEALNSDRYLDLLDRLHAAQRSAPVLSGVAGHGASADPWSRASAALPALVRQRSTSLRRRVRKAGRHPSDRDLHKIRIQAKRLRYAAEMAEPVIGKPARRTARAAEELQTVLGELHDAAGAEGWLGQLGSAPAISPAAAFEAGAHCRQQQLRQASLRRRWPSSWKKLDRKKNRTWLAHAGRTSR